MSMSSFSRKEPGFPERERERERKERGYKEGGGKNNEIKKRRTKMELPYVSTGSINFRIRVN